MSQREDLLAGAKRCLTEKGYGRTTARDIAAASGTHLGAIGYHFGSKDNLMNTAVLEATSEWGDRMEAAVRAAQAGDPARRLEVFLTELFAAVHQERDLLVASIQAYSQAHFDESIRTRIAAGFAEARTALAAMVLGAAEVDEATADELGSLVYALVTGYLVQSLADPDFSPPPDRLVTALHRLAS
ncbi:TetR/AcrR family transcriptional regulator [Saccharopolyspora cebuensis]|uniref:TetR/AcrR family transcriptional regulator n=1 Tax=Saccharopolyspora cebuensis TaxID=418759 RepID=A0ABV4CE09_9PSEU